MDPYLRKKDWLGCTFSVLSCVWVMPGFEFGFGWIRPSVSSGAGVATDTIV